MIMVTHDMYLKNFANRVVWMRDGKVARVETIQPEKREKAIHELSLKLAEVRFNLYFNSIIVFVLLM
jgi:putative ABC transport system ATP-binding protein